MSEESLPAQPLTLSDGLDGGRGRRAERLTGGVADQAGLSSAAARPATATAPAPLRLTPPVAAAAAVCVGYALVAGGFRRLTLPAELATFVAGSVITWQALRKDCRRYPRPDHVDGKGSLAWGAILVVFAIWELYADVRGSTPAHPTLSILMRPILQDPTNRAIGYLAWLGAGIWVVRR
jgi:hypothetical protein